VGDRIPDQALVEAEIGVYDPIALRNDSMPGKLRIGLPKPAGETRSRLSNYGEMVEECSASDWVVFAFLGRPSGA